MAEERPLKRSEVLAIENVKRIANQLRSERNDALALAQIRREELEVARQLLRECKGILDGLQDTAAAALAERIDQHMQAAKDSD